LLQLHSKHVIPLLPLMPCFHYDRPTHAGHKHEASTLATAVQWLPSAHAPQGGHFLCVCCSQRCCVCLTLLLCPLGHQLPVAAARPASPPAGPSTQYDAVISRLLLLLCSGVFARPTTWSNASYCPAHYTVCGD
jgi:hypothetical protein